MFKYLGMLLLWCCVAYWPNFLSGINLHVYCKSSVVESHKYGSKVVCIYAAWFQALTCTFCKSLGSVGECHILFVY